MAIIIREVGAPASEWVYLDNTTNYVSRQSKRLTSNPIENRSVVADHGIKDNKKFSVSGSISPWDFHLAGGTSRLDSDGNVAITSVGSIVVDKTISDYLPSTITQYSDFSSDVKVADITLNEPTIGRDAYLNSVEVKLQALYDSDSLIDVYFADYSGEGDMLISSVVMTSLVFSEDLNTGDSRRVDLSFEQPVIAYVSTATVPAQLINEQTESSSEGTVTGTTITETSSPTVYGQGVEVISNFFSSD